MSGILVIAEHRRGRIVEASWQVVAAAITLARPDEPVTLAIVAADPAALSAAAGIAGVSEVLGIRVEVGEFDAGIVAQTLEPVLRDRAPSLVLAAHTVTAAAFGPRLAVRLGLGFASNAVDVGMVDGRPVVTREILGGKARAEVTFDGHTPLVLLRAEGRSPAASAGAPTYIELVAEIDPQALRSRHVAYEEPPAGEADLTRAEVVVTVGRGVSDRDALVVFESVAAKLAGALGSSRPIVDAGWLPRSQQVGQSGATVKPKVYLAFGVSGAREHLAGMRQSGTIVAINTDPRAPIFDVADYGATVDAVEVAEELERLL